MSVRTYKEFKQGFKRFFLESPDFIASELVSGPDDIPMDKLSYKNVIIRAYVFLSNCKSKDIGHLKILTNYEKLMKKNREAGMNTSPVDFATMLFVFHQYCVRILRSPWRTDFFMIKIYNGFFEYTLRNALAPSVIDDMMAYIGFRRDEVDNVFVFTMRALDHACVRSLTDAGIGFFLSYTHCMAKNDLHFKKTVPGLLHLLQNEPEENPPPSLPPAIQRPFSPEEPSTSGLDGQERRSRTEPHSMTARDRRREKRNLYGSDRPSQSMSFTARTGKADLYESSDIPGDVPIPNGTPYGHRVKRISDDRQSNSSHGSGCVDLYSATGSDAKSATNQREISPETLPPEHTRNSSTFSKRGHSSTLDSQMEKVTFKDRMLSSGYGSMLEVVGKPLLDPSRKYHPNSYSMGGYDSNYVKFQPLQSHSSTQRGSPDGEMATDEHRDFHSNSSQQSRTASKDRRWDYSRPSKANEHLYHEIGP